MVPSPVARWLPPLLFLLVAAPLSGCATAGALDSASTPLPRDLVPDDAWADARDALAQRSLAVDSALVLVDGSLRGEWHGDRGGPRTLHDLRSATKSITSLLVGAAIDRGLIDSVRSPVAPWFPETHPHPSWSGRPAMTIEDLLTMRSGLDCDDWAPRSPGNEERMYRRRSWLGFALSLPAVEDPGQRFSYCTAGVVLLGEIVARAGGAPLPELAKEWLFEPLGIADARWEPAGDEGTDAGGHLRLSVESLAKIGQLTLQGGEWEGRPVVSAGWIAASTTPHTWVDSPDGGPQYGYLWWLEPVEDGVVRSWQARGNGGQLLIVVPPVGAVVALTGRSFNRGSVRLRLFQLTSRHLIPLAASLRGGGEAADEPGRGEPTE